MRPADVEMCCARIRAQGTRAKAARELGTRLADYDGFMLREAIGMARLPQKVDARYERLKCAEREGGSILLSKATMRYVAETATDGQFAFFEDALAREYALRHQSRIARLKRQANFPSQKGFDGFEWSGIVFPRGFTRDDMLSLCLHRRPRGPGALRRIGQWQDPYRDSLGACSPAARAEKSPFWSTVELVSELRACE